MAVLDYKNIPLETFKQITTEMKTQNWNNLITMEKPSPLIHLKSLV